MEKEYRTNTEKIERLLVLTDNLVRAVETGDATAMEQAAGAAREFLDKYNT